jgi:hypothetical protein
MRDETKFNQLMDFDADNSAGAARHERSPDQISAIDFAQHLARTFKVGGMPHLSGCTASMPA